MQAAADAGTPLRVRLAALFHDAGKPQVAWRGTDGRLHYYAKRGYATKSHEQVSAELAGAALERLRYPTELRKRVVRIVRAHMFDPGKGDALRARKLLARFGDGLAFDLLDHKEADLRGKGDRPRQEDSTGLHAFAVVLEQEQGSPHRLRDLAVSGDDLVALGHKPGPEIGRTLQALLHDVVRDPEPEHARAAARAGAGGCSRDPVGRARVRRRVHDPARRRQRGAVRLPQPDARHR